MGEKTGEIRYKETGISDHKMIIVEIIMRKQYIMKSKNIPADIRSKSIKEAQTEITDIMGKLENSETKLEESIDQYNRVIQLNQHILREFKKKAGEIRKPEPAKNKKKPQKN